MAIDLPPALPPQLSSADIVLEANWSHGAYTYRIGNYSLQIGGRHYLTLEELEQVLKQASTASEAILRLNAATRNKGHLLVQYIYTRPINGVVYVEAVQKSVGQVSGDKQISRQFSALAGDRDLTVSELEAQAAHSLRTRQTVVNYSLRYRENPGNSESVDLEFTPRTGDDTSALTGFIQFGNQGSRFAGRYFLSGGAAYDFRSGTRLAAAAQTALTSLGQAEEGDNFNQFQVRLDHPFSFGLYGLELSNTSYERELRLTSTNTSLCQQLLPADLCLVPGTGSGTSTTQSMLNADYAQAALTGRQWLVDDKSSQWQTSQRLEWTDSSQEDDATGVKLQDERYATLQFATSYRHASRLGDSLLRWYTRLAVDVGLSADSGTLGSNPNVDGISIGKRSAEFTVVQPKLELEYRWQNPISLGLSIEGQLSNEQLPQQQQWVLGGINRMRAYLPGTLVGDEGYYAETHLGYRWNIGKMRIVTALFAEYGVAQYQDASGTDPSGEVNYSDTSELADAGLSARIKAGDWLEIQAVVATPVADANINDAFLKKAESDYFIVVKALF